MLKDIRFPSINHPVYQSIQTSDTAAWQELTLASDPDLFRREQNAQMASGLPAVQLMPSIYSPMPMRANQVLMTSPSYPHQLDA